mgnify:CR=1 FL=1
MNNSQITHSNTQSRATAVSRARNVPNAYAVSACRCHAQQRARGGLKTRISRAGVGTLAALTLFSGPVIDVGDVTIFERSVNQCQQHPVQQQPVQQQPPATP